MSEWTAERVEHGFANLDGDGHPVFSIYFGDKQPYINVVGDATFGYVRLTYSDNAGNRHVKAGILRDRRLAESTDEMPIDYGTEFEPISLKDTIFIEDALKIVLYFVEHRELPPLPDDLYWEGNM